MIVSGHQSAYLPWLGFFHKLSLCDTFVFMDTVQLERQGFSHRNKVRTPHGSTWLTIPIDKNKSGENLDEIYIKQPENIDDNHSWQRKHFMNIKLNYKNTPYYEHYIDELEKMYMGKKWEKLIDLCWVQFELFSGWLGLDDRKIVRMTEHEFHGSKDDLVLDHCKQLGGDRVVFGVHGKEYVDVNKFNREGIKVYFQDYNHPEYEQKFSPFEPYMCVLDLLFNYGDESMEIINRENVTYNDLKENEKYWIYE